MVESVWQIIYITKSGGPRIGPWGTPLAIISQLEDVSWSNIFDNKQTLCFLFSRWDLNQEKQVPLMP